MIAIDLLAPKPLSTFVLSGERFVVFCFWTRKPVALKMVKLWLQHGDQSRERVGKTRWDATGFVSLEGK